MIIAGILANGPVIDWNGPLSILSAMAFPASVLIVALALKVLGGQAQKRSLFLTAIGQLTTFAVPVVFVPGLGILLGLGFFERSALYLHSEPVSVTTRAVTLVVWWTLWAVHLRGNYGIPWKRALWCSPVVGVVSLAGGYALAIMLGLAVVFGYLAINRYLL